MCGQGFLSEFHSLLKKFGSKSRKSLGGTKGLGGLAYLGLST